MVSTYSAYLARINRVFDHIDMHLAEPLDLETLAAVANFSPYHFHRIFKELTGETLAARVRRRRVEKAASRLVAAPEVTAARIAEEVGFASAEVFTRAFRAHFGMTPTAWRNGGHRAWAQARHAALSKIHQDERKRHQAVLETIFQDVDLWPRGLVPTDGGAKMHVEVKDLKDARVAYMRHVGPYGSAGIAQMWQRFAEWCGQHGLMYPRRVMYGLCLDDPEVTPPDKCRYDACVEVDADFRPQGEIGVEHIAGGRYACARFAGTSADIAGAWGRFVSSWLPDSGYRIDERGFAIEVYGTDFAMDEKTGAFNCELCLPVTRI